MKLEWKSGTGFVMYVSDGEQCSYQISTDLDSLLHPGRDRRFVVLQLRQPAGQVVRRTFALTTEGAMARAQVWENGHG